MSDSMWFIENFEENSSKRDNNETFNDYSPTPSGEINSTLENTSTSSGDEKDAEDSSQDLKLHKVGENKTDKVLQLDILKDEFNLRSTLQDSLMESVEDVKNPEIQITVNSKPETAITNGMENKENFSDKTTNDGNSVFITAKKEENGISVGQEKKIIINNQRVETVETNESDVITKQPKVYVVLLQNTDNGAGAATVSAGGDEVRLVIRVEDGRGHVDETPNSGSKTLKNYSDCEIGRLKEQLKCPAPVDVPGRCTRTVWSTPHGRVVETRCVRDEHPSLWSDLDEEFNRIFSFANRFF